MGWGGWFATGILVILFWALVIWGIVALVRFINTPGRGTPNPVGPEPPRTPEQLLAERFAQGEIGEEEYVRRHEVLDAGKAKSGGYQVMRTEAGE
jgi:putative membrane protein